jgi:YVTN family beta-propeller protein
VWAINQLSIGTIWEELVMKAFACSLAVLAVFCSQPAQAAGGDTVATFNFTVNRFLMSPTSPVMYASVPSLNSVVAIDTNTLSVISTTFVGSNPNGMAISNDGSRLYVANSGSNFLGVLDTSTGALAYSLPVSQIASDVEVGRDGRLYVLGSSGILQIDPNTGASVGPNVGSGFMVYSGEMAISPDKTRLYYADYGLSPASLYQFDVSGGSATLLWESPHGGTSGSNGQDLAISHDGSFISYASGYGQLGYNIAKYRTQDMLIEGVFEVGAYPREITFSPDDAVGYTVNEAGTIKVWDTRTFLSMGEFSIPDEAYELEVDISGRYLFAATGSFGQAGRLRVIDTGRVAEVPEASTAAMLLVGLLITGVASRRRRPAYCAGTA